MSIYSKLEQVSHSQVAKGACWPCPSAIGGPDVSPSYFDIFWPLMLHEVMIIQVCSQIRFFLHKLVVIHCWEVMCILHFFRWIGCVACLLRFSCWGERDQVAWHRKPGSWVMVTPSTAMFCSLTGFQPLLRISNAHTCLNAHLIYPSHPCRRDCHDWGLPIKRSKSWKKSCRRTRPSVPWTPLDWIFSCPSCWTRVTFEVRIVFISSPTRGDYIDSLLHTVKLRSVSGTIAREHC